MKENVVNMESSPNAVTYPEMRNEVMGAVEALADPEYQHRVWIRREYPQDGYYDDLSHRVNILFDDTMVLPSPEGGVGSVIYADEVQPLAALGSVLGPLIADLGDVPDMEYLADARWRAVVEAAQKALDCMRRKD